MLIRSIESGTTLQEARGMKNLITVLASAAILAAGSASAKTMAQGLNITGGDNPFAKLELNRVDKGQSDDGLMRLRMTVEEVQNLKGYGFMLQYDEAKYEFVEAKQVVEGMMGDADGQSGLFVSSNKTPGEVVVGSMRVDGSSADGAGELVEFVFRTEESPLQTDFQILDGILVDVAGNVDQMHDIAIGRLDPIPENYGLAQNMPNPFNPSTTISYEVPESGATKLVVYNLLGQQVRTLIDNTIEAGYHSIVWDGADEFGRQVASGIYIYRMSSGEFAATRRMMFLK
ncbi:MAG: hypothetical protein CME21_17380 [Gemmatimonadetes bacterium]|nr:hypothetical protein [Gemmatimonadota bacterium]